MSERERVPECVERWRGLPASVRDYAGKLIAYTATPEGLLARDCLEYLATAAPAPSAAWIHGGADYPIKLCDGCARKLSWYLEHEAPVKSDASAPELTAQWEPPAKPVYVRADGSVTDLPAAEEELALGVAMSETAVGQPRVNQEAARVALLAALPPAPEPCGCPTPGACSAVAANCYLPMDCPRCGRRRLEASIATDGRRPFVSAVVCEKCGFGGGSDEESKPALCTSTEVREAVRALADNVESMDILLGHCAKKHFGGPDGSWRKLHAALRLLRTARLRDEAEVRAEGAKWMRGQCEDAVDSVTHGYAEPAVSKSLAMAAKVAIRALPTEREDDDG